MTNKQADADAVKHADADSYDPVTDPYDRFVGRYSGRYVERIAFLAEFRPGDRVLDVGTGTGIMALHAADRVGESGRVTGIDLSEGMLAHARAKADLAKLSGRVEFRRMDAEQLEVDDVSFDTAVSLFALRHFPNPDAALAQMHRAVRAGGRLVVAVGGGAPRLSPAGVAAALRRIFDRILILRGRQLRACEFLDGLVRASLPRSSLEGPAGSEHHGLGPLELPGRVRRAGFLVDHVGWLGHRAVIETAEEFWELQATFSSMARSRLQNATPRVVAELKNRFVETCHQVHARGGSLVYPTGVLFVAARRPPLSAGA
ncbi:MAG: methyltransferase domain-containing protein [Betaproteobacteria bacterium]|nr:methyltransferase domain-containing protein [Betaproteobacteria bacterium]